MSQSNQAVLAQPAREAATTLLATYAAVNGTLGKVVEQVNQELARLHRLGAAIDPQTIRFGASANEFGTTSLVSFAYAQPATEGAS